MTMPFDRPVIAGNPSVNATIWRCLDLLANDQATRRYRREFDRNRHDNVAVMNLYRQLVVGGYLAEMGYAVQPDVALDDLTPDWFSPGPRPILVEVFTHHADKATYDLLETGAVAYFDESRNLGRVHGAASEKALKYRALANRLNVPFMIAVCIEFSSVLTPDQIAATAAACEGVFDAPQVSGLLCYRHLNGCHGFWYYANMRSHRPIELPRHQAWR
jgi:hypothetical protein